MGGSNGSESQKSSDEMCSWNEVESLPKKQKKSIYTPRLLAALDKCAVSNRNAVHLISAVITAIGHSIDDYDLSKSGIATYRRENRKEIALEQQKGSNVMYIFCSI